MDDLTFKTTLAADAGPLNAALRSAESGVKSLGDTTSAVNAKQVISARAVTSSVDEQAAATKTATKAVEQDAAAAAAATAAKVALAKAMQAERDATRAATAEANQLRQAYRQLPAQITDIVTSLASGSPAYLVAIQQGGQIKDSFGGIGATAAEMAKAITVARVAMLGVGAAAVAVGVAVHQVAAEQNAYSAALVATNNASGTTVGELGGWRAKCRPWWARRMPLPRRWRR